MWFLGNGSEYGENLPAAATVFRGVAKINSHEPCYKCGGSGQYPSALYNGVCFGCGGCGKRHIIVRAYTPEALQKLKARQAALAAKKEAKRAAIQAERQAAVVAAAAEFEASNPGFIALIGASNNEILQGMVEGFNKWGKLSEKQVAFAKNILEEEAIKAKKLNEFVGYTGKKIVLELVVSHVYHGSGHFGSFTYLGFEDAEGRAFIWKTSGRLGYKRGERVEVKAKIKEHEVYNGVNQTVLSHCKITPVE